MSRLHFVSLRRWVALSSRSSHWFIWPFLTISSNDRLYWILPCRGAPGNHKLLINQSPMYKKPAECVVIVWRSESCTSSCTVHLHGTTCLGSRQPPLSMTGNTVMPELTQLVEGGTGDYSEMILTPMMLTPLIIMTNQNI